MKYSKQEIEKAIKQLEEHGQYQLNEKDAEGLKILIEYTKELENKFCIGDTVKTKIFDDGSIFFVNSIEFNYKGIYYTIENGSVILKCEESELIKSE